MQPGESVKSDELLCEIESDKATTEVTSPVSGVVEACDVEEKKGSLTDLLAGMLYRH